MDSPSADRIRKTAPPLLSLALAILDWMDRANRFRGEEDQFLVDGSYDSLLEDHRMTAASLFGEGETLRFQWKKNEKGLPDLGFSIEDMEATIGGLLKTYVCQHGNQLTEVERQRIAALFPEE